MDSVLTESMHENPVPCCYETALIISSLALAGVCQVEGKELYNIGTQCDKGAGRGRRGQGVWQVLPRPRASRAHPPPSNPRRTPALRGGLVVRIHRGPDHIPGRIARGWKDVLCVCSRVKGTPLSFSSLFVRNCNLVFHSSSMIPWGQPPFQTANREAKPVWMRLMVDRSHSGCYDGNGSPAFTGRESVGVCHDSLRY